MHKPDEEYAGPSKSQLKRESSALQVLGTELTGLSATQLAAIPLPEKLRDAVEMARNISAHGARRRQLQYIGKLMRDIDAEPIRDALDRLKRSTHAAVAREHRLESWRARLVEAGDIALTEFIESTPQVDRQHLRQLVMNARHEHTQGKPRGAGRALFRYLRELQGEGDEEV
jgi:ribosome-associated protein